jgi:ergothioneine biosynthesis protein EgtB
MDTVVEEELSRFERVRARSEALCKPLVADDYVVQSMPDVSPPKWHLAHTSWFFEEFLLASLDSRYVPVHVGYRYLFNSYYETLGARIERARRGLLSRPSVDEVYTYRSIVDRRVREAAERGLGGERALFVLRLGCDHEEQHQELLLTDIKHILWSNPLRPSYEREPREARAPGEDRWLEFSEGLREIGADGRDFAFDNESPRHVVFVPDFQICANLVNCGEFLEFIEEGCYRRPALWLSDGWAAVQKGAWEAPLYWEPGGERAGGEWWQMTLSGMRRVEERAPVVHVSYYEADAFARWRGLRLPTEQEWEVAALELRMNQVFDEAWQWTQSAYHPYPGFRPAPGAFGEYNGKFMCNQLVLRGGSSATPPGHSRVTYRNFFQAEARWKYSGIRLAR